MLNDFFYVNGRYAGLLLTDPEEIFKDASARQELLQ